MIKATYRTMPELIANRMPFTHGSAYAEIEADGTYAVFSYSTRIAGITSSGVKTLNERKYSMTTSRLQNIIRNVWELN